MQGVHSVGKGLLRALWAWASAMRTTVSRQLLTRFSSVDNVVSKY
jgi:hypothetical protein